MKETIMNFTTISQAKKATGLSYLGSINSSSKLEKNGKVSGQYTYVMYLAPALASGFNVCPMATEECIAGCLNTSGRVKMDNKNIILNSRIKKTQLFFNERDFFMNWLVAEIAASKVKAKKAGFKFSVRLNGTSDINWNTVKVSGQTIFQIFPNVQFYDYTKVDKKFNHVEPNYHLTFSFSGYNWDKCEDVLTNGYNVAAVFNIKKGQPFPTMFKGFKVIDGDLTDYRPDDERGTIVGLRWKIIRDKAANDHVKKSAFVVQP